MRKLMWFTIGFAAASFAGATLLGDWILLGSAAAFALCGIFVLLSKKFSDCRLPFVIALGCAAGLCWFAVYDHLFVTVPRAADGETWNVTIEASDYSYESGYGSAVEGTVQIHDKDYRVKAYLNTKDHVAPGDLITGRFRFRLTTLGGSENPTSHRSEGIFLLAYPEGDAHVEKAEHISLRHYPAVWRHQLLERIYELFPAEAGAFAAALLFGDRTKIDYELNTAFKVSGISHVIAVSGLHVSILFALVYGLLMRKRTLSCLIGIPVLFLFAAVVGFTPSITRACIMQSLMLIAMLTERDYDPPTALAFAVLVMLVCNPMTVLSVSFQLSVGCMMGIFMFSEPIRQWLSNLKYLQSGKGKSFTAKLKRGIASTIAVTLSAMSITTPLVAYYFGCVSIVGVLTNLLVLWVISFVFYGVMLCLAISLVSTGLATLLGAVLTMPIGFILGTSRFLSKLPMAAVYTASPYVVVWLCCTYLLLIIFLLQRRKHPKWLLLSIALTLLISQACAWFEPLGDGLRMTVLDVGQGQSILLQSEGKTFLVDCGGDDGEKAADVAAEALLSQGIARLDGIIVTHYDEDHTGGIPHLLTRIKTDRLILPDMEDERQIADALITKANAAVEYISRDMLYTFAEANLTIIAPFSHQSDNENSLCVLFHREDCDILITGDRGEWGEKMLLYNHTLPDLDLLVVGHHGSASSTSEALLTVTRPEIAVISVGEDNRFGHPSEEVLERLMHFGCQIYRTDIHSTIIYRR